MAGLVMGHIMRRLPQTRLSTAARWTHAVSIVPTETVAERQRGCGWLITGDGFRLGGDCLRRRSRSCSCRPCESRRGPWQRVAAPAARSRTTWTSTDRSTLLMEWVRKTASLRAQPTWVRLRPSGRHHPTGTHADNSRISRMGRTTSSHAGVALPGSGRGAASGLEDRESLRATHC